jgi:hypothetical protein
VATAERHVGSLWTTGTYREIYYTDRAITNYSDKKKTCGANFKKYECKRRDWDCNAGPNRIAEHDTRTGHYSQQLINPLIAASGNTPQCPNKNFRSKHVCFESFGISRKCRSAMDAAEFTSTIRGLDGNITRNTVFVFKDGRYPEYYFSRDRTKCYFKTSAPSFECVKRPRWYCSDAGEFHVVHRKSDGEITSPPFRPQSPVNRNRPFGLG